MKLECKDSMLVAEMVNSLHAKFDKSDETKRKESVSLIKESTQFTPPRYQEIIKSTSTRRMERESEKPKSIALRLPVPQPAPVQPQPEKAPKYSRKIKED